MFVSGKYIMDNTMVAFKVVHYIKVDICKQNNNVALKLDISKVYDYWVYLKEVMLKLGFTPR